MSNCLVQVCLKKKMQRNVNKPTECFFLLVSCQIPSICKWLTISSQPSSLLYFSVAFFMFSLTFLNNFTHIFPTQLSRLWFMCNCPFVITTICSSALYVVISKTRNHLIIACGSFPFFHIKFSHTHNFCREFLSAVCHAIIVNVLCCSREQAFLFSLWSYMCRFIYDGW